MDWWSSSFWLWLAASLVIGYLLGAIPFAAMAGRLAGVDVRSVGTGNPGAANVFRVIDRRLGLLVGVADVAKGVLAVQVGRWAGLPDLAIVLPGAAAVFGHWHSVFLGFRGGAGLAVAVGAGVAVVPLEGGIGVAVAIVLIALIRNVGVSAGIGYVAALAVGLALREHTWMLVEAAAPGVVVMVRTRWLERRWWPLAPRRG